MDLLKKGATLDAQEKIVELRAAAIELQEENIKLREENRGLREAQELSTKLVRVGNCYYLVDDVEHERPYCMACWDAERKLVSLILIANSRDGSTGIRCSICEARKRSD